MNESMTTCRRGSGRIHCAIPRNASKANNAREQRLLIMPFKTIVIHIHVEDGEDYDVGDLPHGRH
jgi:hypothetical protein